MTFLIQDPERFPCGCKRSEDNIYVSSRGTKRCLYHTRKWNRERREKRKSETHEPVASGEPCLLEQYWSWGSAVKQTGIASR